MVDIAESRKKTIENLKKELEKLRKDAQKVSSEVMQKKEKNVSRIKLFRKDTARLQMIIGEKLKENKNEL